MQPAIVSADTQVVLLLCGHFSPKEAASPLELREYNRLADWMRTQDVMPSGLLAEGALMAIDWTGIKLDRDRLEGLLQRGGALALAVDRWTGAGIWILSRADEGYPRRVRSHLGRSAPALLFGVGDAATLDRGGLSIVGSRDIDAEGQAFTADVAKQCARENIPVVSGGARGVDEIALAAVFEAGGYAVAALPEGLGKASLAARYREGIREERLVLVSPYAPHAGFSVGNAMGRNKLIYALGDAALIVKAALRSGGTWAGAEEELKRDRARLLFVRLADRQLEGNEALIEIGARPFPNAPWEFGIRDVIFETEAAPVTTFSIADGQAEHAWEDILPRILRLLAAPSDAASLAKALDLQPAQLKEWLDRAVREGRVAKSGTPPQYSRADSAKQGSLFGN